MHVLLDVSCQAGFQRRKVNVRVSDQIRVGSFSSMGGARTPSKPMTAPNVARCLTRSRDIVDGEGIAPPSQFSAAGAPFWECDQMLDR